MLSGSGWVCLESGVRVKFDGGTMRQKDARG